MNRVGTFWLRDKAAKLEAELAGWVCQVICVNDLGFCEAFHVPVERLLQGLDKGIYQHGEKLKILR